MDSRFKETHKSIIELCKLRNWSTLKLLLSSSDLDSKYKILISAIFETYQLDQEERNYYGLSSWNNKLSSILEKPLSTKADLFSFIDACMIAINHPEFVEKNGVNGLMWLRKSNNMHKTTERF